MQQEVSYSKTKNSLCQFSQHQAYCLKHPSNQIINFCTNPLCLMPLCKECIKVHTYDHYQYGTQANFETIDDVTGVIYEQTRQLWEKYQNHLERNTKFQEKLQKHKIKLKQQLALAKEKILNLVENHFSELQEQIENKQDICTLEQSSKLQTQIEFISKKYEDMEQILQKLNSDNFLKYVILMMNSSDAVEENLFAKESETILQNFDNQLMDVMIDKVELKNIKVSLNSYVNVENFNLYNDKSTPELQISPQHLTQRTHTSSNYFNLNEKLKTVTCSNTLKYSQIASNQHQNKQQQQQLVPSQFSFNISSDSRNFHQRMPSSGNILAFPTEILHSQNKNQSKRNNNFIKSISINKNQLPLYFQLSK